MAAVVGLSLVGLFIVFFSILLIIPYIKMIFPDVSGFADFSCREGEKPCPEGYFCATNTCVPVSPSYDINGVQPSS